MEIRTKFAKDTIFIFCSAVFSKVSLFLINIFIGRNYGAEKFGEYNYVLSLIMIISTVSILGLDTGLLRYIPKSKVDKNDLYRKNIVSFSVYIVLVISLSFCILLNIFSASISEKLLGDVRYSSILRIMSLLLVLVNIEVMLIGVLRGSEKNILSAIIADVIRPLTFSISIIILYYIKYNVNGLAISRLVSYLPAFIIILIYTIKEKYYQMPEKHYNSEYKEIIRFSLQLMLLSSIIIFTNKINILMIGRFLNDKSVGIFTAASQVSLILAFALTAVNSIFMPKVAKLYYEKKYTRIQKMYSYITFGLGGMTIVSVFVLFIFKSDIMKLFGEEFIQGASALFVLSIGQAINSITGPCGTILIMYGFPKYEIITNIILLVCVIMFNIILIPMYGYIGAAYSTAFSVGISNLIKVFVMVKKTKITPFKNIFSQ